MNELDLPKTKNSSLDINAGKLAEHSEDIVSQITSSLSIPRSTLPSNDDINVALSLLPRELHLISPRLRDQFIVKACVAITVGLFDGAIVYVWNSVIRELRKQVNSFGLEMIKNISGTKKDDNFLENIGDSELLELCYQLNIINEEGYFYLSQCREIRNHASIAHPTEIQIDDRELINFISRCCKYGLSDQHEIIGIDMKMFISVIESHDSNEDSLSSLSNIILGTFESQKELIIQILYSKFTDATNPSHIRDNSLRLSILLKPILTSKMISSLMEQHNENSIIGDPKNTANSRNYFEKMELLSYLKDAEKIAIFKKNIDNLKNAHLAFYNFYNEPPFAERLHEVSTQITPIPEVVIEEYIETNIMCYLGNSYGVSESASPFYYKMLTNLTPKGIEVLLNKLEFRLDHGFIMSVPFKKKQTINIFDYYSNSSLLNIDQKNKLSALRDKFSL